MVEQLVEAVVIFACIAGLAYLVGLAGAHIAEQRILAGMRSGLLEERLQRMMMLAAKARARRDEMLPRLVRLDAQVKSVRRRHYMVQKRLSDMSVSRSSLVRVLGEEEAFHRAERPSRRFIALVINRHVQRAQLEQKEHPFLARSWARAQQVHVWAPTIGDAKIVVERAFPPATGFFVLEVAEPADDTETMEVIAPLPAATPAALQVSG
ncbi:hypothetical protein [Indioceanicola profundi]|uniref:hypothetical protein n=1 Tax=Indioceanicola profundi TaxID=2220096 RepID=UPI000E6AD409|nr:hypothetical protein [Indioceanicola profundi]